MAAGNDLAFQKLRANGYVGALGDMLFKWEQDNPTIGGAPGIMGPDVWDDYWKAYTSGAEGLPPDNSLTHEGHNLSISGHWLVWS